MLIHNANNIRLFFGCVFRPMHKEHGERRGIERGSERGREREMAYINLLFFNQYWVVFGTQ